jgi:hypothetical protein
MSLKKQSVVMAGLEVQEGKRYDMGSKWTKEYKSEYMKKWREENKEYIKKYRKKHYQQSRLNGTFRPADKDKAREYQKRWREKHREQYLAHQREYQKKRRMRKALEYWEGQGR